MIRWPPNGVNINSIGGHLSTVTTRDRSPKGGGQSPQFKMRITPELKEQLEVEAAKDNVSLANWMKELARQELIRRGVVPKG